MRLVCLQGLWMSKEREVLYVIATRIRFMCPMNFNKFPMDTQTCKFQVSKKNFHAKIVCKIQETIKCIPNSLLRLGHSIMTTLRWSTGLTIFL